MGKTRNSKLNKDSELNKNELIVIGIGVSAGGLEALENFLKD